MAEKERKRKTVAFDDPILRSMLDDPTRSPKAISKELGITRQRLWREKKSMEEEGIIWGYTGVEDGSGSGWVDCVMLFVMKALSEDFAKVMNIETLRRPSKEYGVRVKEAYYMNGDYDVLITFSAPDIAAARRFYEYLRREYERFFMEKPRMMEVAFPIVKGGKLNPRMERVRELIP
jgi:DNA-binding Lrp family transcriptional regulator